MKKFVLNKEFITLSQFLKANDYISSGGEAKFFLLNNDCFINNELIKLRGKKIFKGDTVKIFQDEYLIEDDK